MFHCIQSTDPLQNTHTELKFLLKINISHINRASIPCPCITYYVPLSALMVSAEDGTHLKPSPFGAEHSKHKKYVHYSY
jgi:hypothetical protein